MMVAIFGYTEEAASRTKKTKSERICMGKHFANEPTHRMQLIVMSRLLENKK
jgi:hypothetical protein